MAELNEFKLGDSVRTKKGAQFWGIIIAIDVDDASPGCTVFAVADGFAGTKHVYPLKQIEHLASQPTGWKLVPEDLLTHIGSWRYACQLALESAGSPEPDKDDRSYWAHQIATLDNIQRQLSSTP